MRIVILGLSITSSWGNGHATTYRSLVRALTRRGHDVLFLERDMPWYAAHRDLPAPPYGAAELYASLSDLRQRFTEPVREADLVIVGSYVPEGVAASEWVLATARGATAFYDIDTPVTLARLDRGDSEYISRPLVARYDLYLSFTGGPILRRLQKRYGAKRPRPFYCSVDPDLYFPEPHREPKWDLGYLGTYSDDRQPALNSLLIEPAKRFEKGRLCVAGSLYPSDIQWPANVHRIEHLPPSEHRRFYNSQRWTLNITRADMVKAGYSPSVRLFEAAACATPIMSDEWPGLGEIFEIGSEIVVVKSTEDALRTLREVRHHERNSMAQKARAKVLAHHTSDRRAAQLEHYAAELLGSDATVRSKIAV